MTFALLRCLALCGAITGSADQVLRRNELDKLDAKSTAHSNIADLNFTDEELNKLSIAEALALAAHSEPHRLALVDLFQLGRHSRQRHAGKSSSGRRSSRRRSSRRRIKPSSRRRKLSGGGTKPSLHVLHDTRRVPSEASTSKLLLNTESAVEKSTLTSLQAEGKTDLVEDGGNNAEELSYGRRKWIVAIVGAFVLAASGMLYAGYRSRAWTRSNTDQAADRVARRVSSETHLDTEDDAGDWHPLRHLESPLQVLGLLDDDIPELPTLSQKSLDAPERVQRYIDNQFTSFRLLLFIVGALAQVWGMLGLIYYTLLMNEDDLMECFAADSKGHPRHGSFKRHLCTYTQACLRGFPLMSVNLTTVLMIRIIIQMRIYYSFLRERHVLDFADTFVMMTQWPWICALSMAQGGLHLVLKMLCEQDVFRLSVHLEIARRFLVPGCIFLSFFLRYVEIEGSLVPLNRIIERDYTKENRKFHTLGEMKAIYERVACWDARHRDVIGEVMDANGGKPPPLRKVIQNIIDNYENAAADFYSVKTHFQWGFFRSLWPAALLLDHRRLDWQDQETRHWLVVITVVLAGCLVVSFISLCFFVAAAYRNISIAFLADIDVKYHGFVSETILANVVLVAHALIVLYFLHRTYNGMFHFEIKSSKEVPTEQLLPGKVPTEDVRT